MARLNTDPRSNESPMDWEWQHGHGPISSDSPFPQGEAISGQFYGFAGQKRSASSLDSPSKLCVPNPPLTPSTPSKKPPVQFRKPPSFTTPQRPFEADLSSGPEQSSPANADSEDTPEGPPARVRFGNYKSDKKSSSLGIFDKLTARKAWPNAVAQRIHKRRRRNADKDVRLAPRRSNNPDSDSEERPSSSEGREQKAVRQQMGFIPSVLTFIDAHPSLPHTLSYYVQFILNCFFAFCMMYVLYGVYSTISNDINERAMMESSEILAEMAVCAQHFKENRCERDSRVPAMETVCNNWEKCMQRDPYKVGRSRLSAGMFAEIFNSFIEPISLKAIIFSISVIVCCFTVNNLTFGLWRAKTHQTSPENSAYMHQQPQQQMGYPSNMENLFTQYQNQGVSQGGYNQGSESRSPNKRLGYR